MFALLRSACCCGKANLPKNVEDEDDQRMARCVKLVDSVKAPEVSTKAQVEAVAWSKGFEQRCLGGGDCVEHDVVIDQPLCLNKSVCVHGSVTVKASACINGDVMIAGDLRVEPPVAGNTSGICLNGDAVVVGNAYVAADTCVAGKARVQGALTIELANVDIAQSLKVDGETRVISRVNPE